MAQIFQLPVTQTPSGYATTRTALEGAVQAVVNALDARIANAETGKLGFATWAELASISGAMVGQLAQVTADAGTHTDPVVGGTVDNEGEYRWSAEPAGWERVGELADDAVVGEVQDAREGKSTLLDNLEDIRDQIARSSVGKGLGRSGAEGNLWTDPLLTGSYSSIGDGSSEREIVEGRAAITLTGPFARRLNISRYRFEGTHFSAGLTVLARTGSSASTRILLRQMAAGGSEISEARQTLNSAAIGPAGSHPQALTFDNVEIHEDAASFELYPDAGSGDTLSIGDVGFYDSPVGAFRPVLAPEIIRVQDSRTVWVGPSGTGSASNPGTYANPVLTLEHAQSLVGRNGIIMLKEGIWTGQNFDLSTVGTLKVMAEPGAVVQLFLQSATLTSFTKTGGYENIYQASLGGVPNAYVFDQGTPYGEIELEDRHPLHRGRTYRLTSSPLFGNNATAGSLVNSLEALDATPGAFYRPAGGILYFHMHDSGDPTGKTLRVPHGSMAGCSGAVAGKTGHVEFHGIQVLYARNGLNFAGVETFRCVDVSVIGADTQGFVTNGTVRYGELIRCEAGGCGGDGGNWHAETDSASGNLRQQHIYEIDCWMHDCGDDGSSPHERVVCTYEGGIYEANRDRGIAVAFGASGVSRGGTVAQLNGNGGAGSFYGEGFAVVGSAVEAEGGKGTTFLCIDPISRKNNYNFAVHGDSGTDYPNNTMRVLRGVSHAALTTAYSATRGKLTLTDCGDIGSNVVTDTFGTGGVIEIENTTLVTT